MGGEEQKGFYQYITMVCFLSKSQNQARVFYKRFSPHPPTPSPQKFGVSLIKSNSGIVRIYGGRGS